MRLVLIHGRGQGHWTGSGLRKIWEKAFDTGLHNAGLTRPDGLEIAFPFYGKRLDQLTKSAKDGLVSVIERGGGGGDTAVDEFDIGLLERIAEAAGITRDEILAEMEPGVVERGPQNWELVQALGRLISRRLPWLAKMGIARFTADVHAYLTHLGIRRKIHEIIQPEIAAAPCVVLAHSLGSIIAYWLLTEMKASAEVRLFVTVGSPLGIDTIRARLPGTNVPTGVAHWLNAVDERDPVALYSDLNRDTFAAGIENLTDIHNPQDDPHGIRGYLGDPEIARRLHEALTSL